jgi:hypothetical protein
MAVTGKLEKMLIIPFTGKKMNIPLPPLTPMYNPTSISYTVTNVYDKVKKMNKGVVEQKFIHRTPRTLNNIELFFDGTGASPSASKGIGINTVFGNNIYLQIQTFQKLATSINPKNHRPGFFLFAWGTFVFPGVIESMAVNYNLFDSNGIPLRAKVTLTIKEHIDDSALSAALRLLSPDLTQSRVVKAGDNLHNLAKEIYEDDSLYMELARVNNLKNYRQLVPGQTLIFPPVEKLKKT